MEAQLQRHEAESQAGTDQMALLLHVSRSGKSDAPFTLLAPMRDRIKQTCQSIIAAGSDTTGTTLTALFHFLLHNKKAMSKLMEEVESQATSVGDNGIFPLQTARRKRSREQRSFISVAVLTVHSSTPYSRRPTECLT